MKEFSCRDIKDLKKDYEKLRRKYALPDFEKFSEDFDIEKILEKESIFLLRDIRRIMNDKLSAYLHLFETLINPSSPPMFIFSILKNIKQEQRKTVKEIYQRLAKIQLEAMKLDTIYDEKKEADFVNNVFKEWQKFKLKINSLLDNFDKKFKQEQNSNNRGYFG